LRIPKICCIFAAEFGNDQQRTMSAVALQGLLDYLMGTLNKSNRVWLAEHLVMPEKAAETPDQKYVRKSLTRALDEVKEAEKAGRLSGRPIEELLAEL